MVVQSKQTSPINKNSNSIHNNNNFDFKFSQCFGDKQDIVVTEADIITAVEFDSTGDYLATGDKGGRVVLFERNKNNNNTSSSSNNNNNNNNVNNCEYKFLTEFQSHDAEFDYLKSLEIEEKINQIKWLKPIQKSHFLLTTNDKTIKLWKIFDKNIKLVSKNNLSSTQNINSTNTDHINIHDSIKNLTLPKLSNNYDKIIIAQPKRIFSNAHTYHINSISPNSDQETFISADDLRINLWNLNIPDQSFNIVDIKPTNMEELTEVITCANFHPQSCNLFMYSSSKGTIRLCDMRQNALCDYKSQIFEEFLDPNSHNFFTEITSSISDIKFSPNGRYIASRDYLTIKIWDINMNNKPIKTINIHDQLKERLSDTYENDAIFDKFEIEFSGDSKSLMTGSYNNNFMIYPNVINTNSDDKMIIQQQQPSNNIRNDNHINDDIDMNDLNDNNNPIDEIVLQADKTAFKNKRINTLKKNTKDWGDDIDFKKSILHFTWHPRENSIALAATNNLFIFSAL